MGKKSARGEWIFWWKTSCADIADVADVSDIKLEGGQQLTASFVKCDISDIKIEGVMGAIIYFLVPYSIYQ